MLEISESSIYRPILCRGLDGVEVENLFSPYATRNGAEYRGCVIAQREILLTFGTQNAVDAHAREKLIRFLRPGQKSLLSLQRDTVIKYIDCYIGSVRFEQETLYEPLRVSVSLSCPDVWFYGQEREAGTFDRVLPLLSFPFFSLAGKGMTGGVRTNQSECVVKNDGDLETGFLARFRVTGGEAKHLTLSLGEQRITLRDPVLAGDEVEICTRDGEKYVYINRQSARFMHDSVFFPIPQGQGRICVSFDRSKDKPFAVTVPSVPAVFVLEGQEYPLTEGENYF